MMVIYQLHELFRLGKTSLLVHICDRSTNNVNSPFPRRYNGRIWSLRNWSIFSRTQLFSWGTSNHSCFFLSFFLFFFELRISGNKSAKCKWYSLNCNQKVFQYSLKVVDVMLIFWLKNNRPTIQNTKTFPANYFARSFICFYYIFY